MRCLGSRRSRRKRSPPTPRRAPLASPPQPSRGLAASLPFSTTAAEKRINLIMCPLAAGAEPQVRHLERQLEAAASARRLMEEERAALVREKEAAVVRAAEAEAVAVQRAGEAKGGAEAFQRETQTLARRVRPAPPLGGVALAWV